MKDRVYRFAEFELIAAEGELRTKDSASRLQEKPFLLLSVLLDNPQRLVTREQLREHLWGSDTFVDYEQGINVAIKKVRDTLGDSAENPKFIETIPKKGYRFLLPVEVIDAEVPAPPIAAPQAATAVALAPLRSVRRGWSYALLALGVLSAIGFWLFRVQAGHAHSTKVRSLAVLPLRNLSPDSGQDYFADGITEDVITDLAQSLPMRVISRTSVMRYKQTTDPITQIAHELGVEAIVEGAVARSGNRVVVTVQLIDATEDRHLWARRYDRDAGDILEMEAELSQEIASRIGGTLTAQAAVTAAKTRPVDPQVYELCLLARYHWNKRTAADLAKSAEYYQQALARDPNYAPAYAGLASAYALMPHYAGVGIQDNFRKGAAAARRALELDDTLAEAHATLGLIVVNTSDWKQAEAEFRRALELNHNYATAHHWYAFYLVFSGRESDALAEMELARQLDPLSVIINADQGKFLYGARHYEEAKVRLRQAIELAPDFGQPYATLAMIELETGHPSEALKEARTALALAPDAPSTMGEAGYVFGVTGHADEARKLLATLKDLLQRGSAFHSQIAMIQLGLGRRDEAFDTLEEMVNSKIGVGLLALNQSHAFDELKTDPRYPKLLSQQAAQR